MYARVRAVPMAEYRAWVARQVTNIQTSQRELARSRQQREQTEQGGGESTVDG